jgi:hypothetical protein
MSFLSFFLAKHELLIQDMEGVIRVSVKMLKSHVISQKVFFLKRSEYFLRIQTILPK